MPHALPISSSFISSYGRSINHQFRHNVIFSSLLFSLCCYILLLTSEDTKSSSRSGNANCHKNIWYFCCVVWVWNLVTHVTEGNIGWGFSREGYWGRYLGGGVDWQGNGEDCIRRSFVIWLGDQVLEREMGEACGTKGGEIFAECWQEKPKDRDASCKSERRFKDNVKMYFSGAFPGVKRPGRGADHPPHLTPK